MADRTVARVAEAGGAGRQERRSTAEAARTRGRRPASGGGLLHAQGGGAERFGVGDALDPLARDEHGGGGGERFNGAVQRP